ncbi:sodium-independent anion transporter [Yoonia sp. R2-816]|uniref:sodium-independent anion transporter n=1 Tax=Yoonia sp. R2-816 TaxID=3342638 RepID=UPI003727993B
MAEVGRVAETEHFRNVLRHEVQTHPDVLAVRVDESLYFANTAFLEDELLARVADQPRINHLVLIMSAVSFIDASALETLETPGRTPARRRCNHAPGRGERASDGPAGAGFIPSYAG